MNITADAPLAVLNAVRAARTAPAVTDSDFTEPTGDETRAIEVAAPGLIHPAHFGWVAEILGRSEESLVSSLSGIHDGDGLTPVTEALRSAKTPARLRALGVKAEELVIRRFPVSPGSQRPNATPLPGSGTVLSAVNAAYQDLLRSSHSVQKLTDLDGPPIIIESRALSMMAALERLLHLLGGKGHRWTPQHEHDTDPPTPPELVVMPRRRTEGLYSSPMIPAQVRLVGTTAIIRFPVALACIDVTSGEFSVQPFAEAGFVSVTDSEAVFCDGARLSVLDVQRRQFVTDPRHLPPRVILGACCGVEILDTASRTTALLPGPLASSAFEFVTSPCGSYGWLEIAPRADELGVFSLQDVARVYQVWPHAEVGMPAESEDPGEGHDDTPRALARLEDGTWRFVYGRHLLHGPHAYELSRGFTAAAFDPNGTRLAVVDATHLSLFALNRLGEPTLSTRWSLEQLGQHLTADRFDFTGTGLDANAVLAATGTIENLASLTPSELIDRAFFDEEPDPKALARLVADAQGLRLPRVLRRA